MVTFLLIQIQIKGISGGSLYLWWGLCRGSAIPRAPLSGEDNHFGVFLGFIADIQVHQGVIQEV